DKRWHRLRQLGQCDKRGVDEARKNSTIVRGRSPNKNHLRELKRLLKVVRFNTSAHQHDLRPANVVNKNPCRIRRNSFGEIMKVKRGIVSAFLLTSRAVFF